jgi:hypothetical protein
MPGFVSHGRSSVSSGTAHFRISSGRAFNLGAAVYFLASDKAAGVADRLAFSVSGRTREFGNRLAVASQPRRGGHR